jgi:hypothetical protein
MAKRGSNAALNGSSLFTSAASDNMLKYCWRIIAKALGDKAHPDSQVANHVASVRFMILVAYMTTNAFICAGVIRHWNN